MSKDPSAQNPGYLLPRGKYKRSKPGKRPEVATRLLEQERSIVERNRAYEERMSKENTNE